MHPKTVFLAITDLAQCDTLLPQAIAAADWFGAHLDILVLGVDRFQVGHYPAVATAIVTGDGLAQASTDAKEMAAAVEARVKQAPTLRWSLETQVAALVNVGRVIAAHARFSDLAILAKPYGDTDSDVGEAVIEGALFGAATRVLVMPPEAVFAAPRRIALAWNDSPEAMSALRGALPHLASADLTKLVIVDPPVRGPDRSDPGGRVSEYLARHGCRVEIDVLSKSRPRVAEVLLRHCVDGDVDLLVMGAYGHSRFREAIMGGATRDMLEMADMPIFMCHA